MGDKSWLSRLFGRATSNQDNASSKSPQLKSIRSPDRVDAAKTGLHLLRDLREELNGTPTPHVDDSLTIDVDVTNRKRQFVSSPEPPRVKRLCDGLFDYNNAELASSRSTQSVPQRSISLLDSPGGMSSRLSTAPSSILSRTRTLLDQLERVNSQQTTVSRAQFLRPVQYKSSSLNSTWHDGCAEQIKVPPPLRRQELHIPSRIQVTPVDPHNKRKPYWRDLCRMRAPEDESVMASPNVSSVKNAPPVAVSPLFDLSKRDVKKSTTTPHSPTATPVLKASDGKRVRSTFSAKELDLEDEADDLTALDKVQPIGVAPPKNFLPADLFDFAFPEDRGPLSPEIANEEKFKKNKQTRVEESSTDESDDSDDSAVKAASPTIPPSTKVTSSAPTDSETSATQTPTSTKQNTPDNATKESKSSEPTPKATISNATSTTPLFAFGSQKVTPSTSTPMKAPAAFSKPFASNAMEKPTSEISTSASKWSCTECWAQNGSEISRCACCDHPRNAAPTPAPKPVAAAVTSTERKDWECPTCMIKNKATDSKCVACEHEMYKDANAASTNVFGSRAFKPASSTVSFGLGDSVTSSSSSAPTISFGFGNSAAPASSTPAPTTFGFKAPVSNNVTKPEGAAVSTNATPAPPIFGFQAQKKEEKENQPVSSFAKPSIFSATSSQAPISSSAFPSSALINNSATEKPSSGLNVVFGAASSSGPAKSVFGSLPTFSASSVTSTATVASSVNQAAKPETIAITAQTTQQDSTMSLFGSSMPAFAAAPAVTKSEAPKLIFDKPATSSLFGSSGALFGTSAPGLAPAAPALAPAAPSLAPAASSLAPAATSTSLFGSFSSNKPAGNDTSKLPTGNIFSQSVFGAVTSNGTSNKTLNGEAEMSDAPATKRAFSSFAAPSAPAPALGGANASGTSLFSFGQTSAPVFAPLNPAPASQPAFSGFNFDAAANKPAAFNFGASNPAPLGAPNQQNAPFVFSAAPTAPVADSNVFMSTTHDMNSPFSFGATSGPTNLPQRKMVSARRRLPGRR